MSEEELLEQPFFKNEIEIKQDIERMQKNFLKRKENEILDFLEKNKRAIRINLYNSKWTPGPDVHDEKFAKEVIYDWFERNGLKREVDIFIDTSLLERGGYEVNFGKTKWKACLCPLFHRFYSMIWYSTNLK